MNARILISATLVTVFAGVLPAKAADPELLYLVMPDVGVLAGVNVESLAVEAIPAPVVAASAPSPKLVNNGPVPF